MIVAFITDHWRELLLVVLFLGVLILGAFSLTVIVMLGKDDSFKESMGDLITWLKLVIIPESIISEKDKIQKLRIKHQALQDK